MLRATPIALFVVLSASAAMAEGFERISDRDQFVSLVQDRALKRFGITVQVTEDGRIEGSAFGYDVTGDWDWQGGYFCRHILWGGDSIGQNCQRVDIAGDEIRFTSDKGAGQSASLTID